MKGEPKLNNDERPPRFVGVHPYTPSLVFVILATFLPNNSIEGTYKRC